MKLQWYCQNIEALSGYSDEARVMVKGLEDLKVEVTVVGSPRKKGPSRFHQSPAINPLQPIVYHTYRHNNYQFQSRMVSIARTMLEVSRIPQSWVYHFRRMDEIWVPNQFNYNSFVDSGVPEEKLFIIPSPVDLIDPQVIHPYPVKSKKNFKFISIFNYEARDRKGLDILLKTYSQSFTTKDDVCLIIKGKTSLGELKKEYAIGTTGPEIEVVNKILSRDELLGLHKTTDCFILPSRGEGIGRPFLDAMMMGTPILTTGWSGQADYLNETNAFLLDYKLVDVDQQYYLKFPGFYGSQWAEPDPEDLALKMEKVIKDHRSASARALQARKDIVAFSAKNICRMIISRLNESTKREPLSSYQPINIFEKLFPVYYPQTINGSTIGTRNLQDFSQEADSLALTGNSHALNRAYHFFCSDMGIKNIYFLEVEKGNKNLHPHLEQNKIPLHQVASVTNLIVIADKITGLSSLYHAIINQVDTLPIYVFSG